MAILAMGRGGPETTHWPVQKEFFDKKTSYLMSSNQSNAMN